MTSSTSLSGTEFTCLAFMYVFCMSLSYLYANVDVLVVNKAHYRFNDKVYVLWFWSMFSLIFVSSKLCFSRSTIKWIKSPLRKWTVWLADPTVSLSGHTSVFGVAAFFSFSVCVQHFSSSFFLVMFQLWDEVEPGLPSGDVMGVLVPDLHLYQEKRRYIDSSATCTQMQFFNFKYFLFLLERPDFNDPIIMRRGSNVEHVVRKSPKMTQTVKI